MTSPWHAYREEVFAVMRQIDEAIQHAWERARFLGTRNGAIPIGSSDFDYTLKATIGEQYLRVLRTGGDTETAFMSSIEAGKEAIAKWNTSGCKSRAVAVGRYELHRNECSAESIALGFHARFVAFRETKPTPTPPMPTSKVRFEPAIVDGSGYCGPVCLSSLTGIGTKQIGVVLRYQFGLKSVRGLTFEQMRWFIEKAGYRVHVRRVNDGTISQLGRYHDGVFLVELDDHWLLLKGSRIVCTEFSGVINDVANSQYRVERMVAGHEIQGELSDAAFKELASPRKRSEASKDQLVLF